MKRGLFLLVVIILVAPVALADPPPASGLVVRDSSGNWAWMWGETGPSLLMGISYDDAFSLCTGQCAPGSEECAFANIDSQSVEVPGVYPLTQRMPDGPAVLLQNPNEFPGWGICDYVLLGKIAEGTGHWRRTWTGWVCPETEQDNWRAQGRVVTDGATPVTINFNAMFHCVWSCVNGVPTCHEEVKLAVQGGGE